MRRTESFQTFRRRLLGPCLWLFLCAIAFNNCSGSFKAKVSGLSTDGSLTDNSGDNIPNGNTNKDPIMDPGMNPDLTEPDGTPIDPNSVRAGAKLYQAHCAGCHNSLMFSTKRGRTAQIITLATKTQDLMKPFQTILTQQEIEAIALALKEPAETCETTDNPGHTTVQRLTGNEYLNGLRDLFQTAQLPEVDLPADTPGTEGFFNIGMQQDLSQLAFSLYHTAAQTITDFVFNNANLRAKVVTCTTNNDSCLNSIFSSFLAKAFRRPVSNQDLTRYRNLVKKVMADEKENFVNGVKQGIQAAILSPEFMFRFISHSKPNDANAVEALSSAEIAQRLSFLLWNGGPDDELLNLAEKDQLRNPSVIAQQVDRMFKDPRTQRMAQNFFSQWLGLRQIEEMDEAPAGFPQFTHQLKEDLIQETSLFVSDLLRSDASPTELLTADFTYLNRSVASIYGEGGITANQFQKVVLDSPNRGGLLTQPAVLISAHEVLSPSIVHRGKWVLEKLLCDLPPPPVMMFPTNDLSEQDRSNMRLTNPNCAKCHYTMDRFGTTLLSFDGLGQFRTKDEVNKTIPVSGVLPDGRRYQNARDLARLVAEDPRFLHCFVRKFTTYALGRPVEEPQMCVINHIANRITRQTPFSEIIQAITTSDLFTKQSGYKSQ